jgi:hypothetical protein
MHPRLIVQGQKNNRSKSETHADLLKPRRRRGRKPSNLSPEEKRRRRLERGRLAANKCRRKKRELENELETRAKGLLAQRNVMLQINHELREELQNLVQQAMDHGDPGCGGIPQIASLVAYFPTFSPPPISQGPADFDPTSQGYYPPQTGSPRLAPDYSPAPVRGPKVELPNEMMDMMYPRPAPSLLTF